MFIKQYVLLLAILALVVSGCASSSGASDKSEGAAETVSGEPPSPEEDTPKQLPEGPEVDVGSAAEDARQQQAAGEPEQAEGADPADSGATVSRAQVDSFIDKGPPFALTMVRVKPSRDAGKFQGFEIVDLKPQAAEVVNPQLVAGDVITHINGVRLEKPDDYLNAWKLLGEVTKIRVDFIRDGESQHATWRIQ